MSPQTEPHPERPKRPSLYRPIGALRFWLALMVVFQHAGVHLLPAEDQEIFSIMGFGIVAVYVFFTISGFVVAEANDAFYAHRPWHFLLNRALRLVPPYFAALALEIAGAACLYHLGKFQPWDYRLEGSPLQPRVLLSGFLCVVPFLHSRYISGQHFEFFAFIWSIRIEFTFYILAAAVYWTVQTPRLSPRLHRLAGFLAFAGGYALFFASIFGLHVPRQCSLIPLFLLGISLLLFWKRRSPRHALLVVFALACLPADYLLWTDLHVAFYRLMLLLVLLAALAALVYVPKVGSRWKRIDGALGNLSYPLYLNHYVVLLTLSDLMPEQAGPALYAFGIALSLMLAFCMHYIVEVPMKGIRDRVRGTPL